VLEDAARAETGGWRALTVRGDVDREGTVRLRPLTFGDLLDEPFLVLRAHLRTILLFAAVAVVPSQLLQGYLARGAFSVFDMGLLTDDPDAFSAALNAEAGGFGGYGVAFVNTLLLVPIAFALISRLAVSSALGERLADPEVVRATLRRGPALAATWLLGFGAVTALPLLGILIAVTVAPLGGGLLVVVGVPVAIVLAILLMLAPIIAVVEGAAPFAALRRSVVLIGPRFWPALGVLSLALLVSNVVQIGVALLPTGFAFLLPEGTAWILASTGATVAGLIATPYTMLVVVLFYLDARVRREALDVHLLVDPPLRSRAGA
jgi:hypothetical protein